MERSETSLKDTSRLTLTDSLMSSINSRKPFSVGVRHALYASGSRISVRARHTDPRSNCSRLKRWPDKSRKFFVRNLPLRVWSRASLRARSLWSCRGCWSIRGYSLASLHFIRTASSRRMKPGGLPCLERTSSQSPVDPTTRTLLPFPMLPTFREEADGSSKTDVLRTV